MNAEQFNEKYRSLLETPMRSEKDFLRELITVLKVKEIPHNSLYITPQGDILDLGDSGEGHALITELLFLKGIEPMYDAQADEYSMYLFNHGWIRANAGFIKYLQLTDKRPTEAQYEVLISLLDALQPAVEIIYEQGSKTYYNRTSEELVKLIRRYYASGVLYEQLK